MDALVIARNEGVQLTTKILRAWAWMLWSSRAIKK